METEPLVQVETAAGVVEDVDATREADELLVWNDSEETSSIAAVVLGSLMRRPEFGGAAVEPPPSAITIDLTAQLQAATGRESRSTPLPALSDLLLEDEANMKVKFSAYASSGVKAATKKPSPSILPGPGSVSSAHVLKAVPSLEKSWAKAGRSTSTMVSLLRASAPGALKASIGDAVGASGASFPFCDTSTLPCRAAWSPV